MKKLLAGCALGTFLITYSGVAVAQDIDRAGSLLTKIGVQGVFPTGKTAFKGNSNIIITDQNGTPYRTKFKNTVGAELAAGYFLTDNFATELSVSYTEYKAKQHNFKDAIIYNELGQIPTELQKSFKTRAIPINLMLQYHTPTIFNAIQPYVGAGYSYYFLNGNKHTYTAAIIPGVYNSVLRIKSKDVHGPVVQVGSNFELGQNFGLNLDVKYAWLKPRYNIRASQELVGLGILSSVSTHTKVKYNPATVTLGLTYRF